MWVLGFVRVHDGDDLGDDGVECDDFTGKKGVALKG